MFTEKERDPEPTVKLPPPEDCPQDDDDDSDEE